MAVISHADKNAIFISQALSEDFSVQTFELLISTGVTRVDSKASILNGYTPELVMDLPYLV